MRLRTILATLFAALVILLLSSAARAAARPDANRPASLDIQRRFDVNRINMFVTNFGSFGWDLTGGGPGLYYPKGTTSTTLFAGGLWLGVPGTPGRVAVAEYSQEYGPGRILSPGVWEPDAPDLVVYKIARWTGNPEDSAHIERTPEELAADPTLDPLVHHSWSEYLAGAAPRGAPTRIYRLPLTDTPAPDDSVAVIGPDVAGDQMLWCVYNDADPIRHSNGAGNTAPIGVEVQQTVFGFNRSGPLSDVVYVRYRIIDHGAGTLDSLIAGLWTDADVGGFSDDLVATDIAHNMGFTYNATNSDAIYGTSPPAIGIRVLGDPIGASIGYRNGTDPQSSAETLNHLRGFAADGSVIVNPVTSDPTHYMFSGDPVTGSGWNDALASDRRQLVSRAATTLIEGDTLEFEAAIVVGRGNDRLGSILQLRCNASFAAVAHGSGFTDLVPEPGAGCPEEACPRPSLFWADQCTGSGISPVDLETIAQIADEMSEHFDWPADLSGMCAVLQSNETDLRAEAERQYAALLANVIAGQFEIPDAKGTPILLSPLKAVNCEGLEAETVQDLIRKGYRMPFLTAVDYVNAPPSARALDGVNFGLPFFDGGASVALDFLGSSLDPVAQADSFATVEIRFDGSQKAYRYLRHERTSDGAAPPLGRRYTYAGFHDVPFQVWDVVRNVQLEAVFVERVLTADDGTILPLGSQPATFDSTWAPDDSDVGGREYLILLRPAYSGVPDPAFEVDGAPIDYTLPALYSLAAKKRVYFGASIDPADLIRFTWGGKDAASIDQMLIDLEGQPLSDPDVQMAYASISLCLEGLNSRCDVPTPALPSIVLSSARPDGVDLAWYAPGLASAAIHRSHGGDWSEVAQVVTRNDRIEWTDHDIAPGERYGYRLVSGGVTYGETWIDVPSTNRLELAGTWPNPAGADARVVLSLKRRSPARLEVIDIAGRRVAQRDVGQLGPGRHIVRIEEIDRLPAGVYLLRITQDGETAFGRMVRIR